MRYVVRSKDGKDRVIEASSWRRDDAGQQFVFKSADGTEDQFIPADGVVAVVREAEDEEREYERSKWVNQRGLGGALGLFLALLVIGVCLGNEPRAKALNFALMVLGVVAGVLTGFLVSPYEDEEKNFSRYGKYLLALLGGYLASKFGPALAAVAGRVVDDSYAAFQLAAFAICFATGLVGSFVARRYPL